MIRNCCVVGVAVTCAAVVTASGQVTYVSRSSSVSASSSNGPTNSQSTTNLDPFDQTVGSTGFHGSAGATQHSSLGSSQVVWSMTSSAISVFASPMQGGPGSGNAGNTFSVTFDVASAQGFELSGSMPFYPGFIGSNYVRLSRVSGEGGAGVIYNHQYPDEGGAYFTSGTLTPGEYTLAIDFTVFAGAGSVWSFDGTGQMTFTPAPGAAGALAMAGVFAARRRRR